MRFAMLNEESGGDRDRALEMAEEAVGSRQSRAREMKSAYILRKEARDCINEA
jgi:hypothetical protein